jgi:hypothetical protein
MSSVEELRNALLRTIGKINNKLSKANSQIIDGRTMQKRTSAFVKKLKLQYAKTHLCVLLEWVRELVITEKEMNARIDKLEEEVQELLTAIDAAGYKAERAESTDGEKGNLYLASKKLQGVERIPVTIFKMQIPQPYTDIEHKRRQQDIQWGGTTHYYLHSQGDWVQFINNQLSQIHYNGVDEPLIDFRERMVDIAALAVAAIESHDRKKAAKTFEAK